MKEKLKLLKEKTMIIGLKESNFYLNQLILVTIKIEPYKNLINHGLILLVMLLTTIIKSTEVMIHLSIYSGQITQDI